MDNAREGDSIALRRVRALVLAAAQTPRRQRSPVQKHLLVCWKGPRTLATPALAPSDSEAPKIFVDASAYGIGFIFNKSWLAWRFTTTRPLLPLGPDGKLVMSWAELVAVEMGIHTLLAAGFRDVMATVHSDNMGVVTAMKAGKWTQKYGLDEMVKRILGLCREGGLGLKMRWIRTKENPADDPSRGIYPASELAFNCRPLIPYNLSELIQDVE